MRPNRLFRTSAFRLTVLFALLFASCVALLFGAIELYSTRALESGLRSTVSARLSGLLGSEPVTTPHLLGAAEAADEQNQGAFILLEDWSGARLAGNLPAVPQMIGWGMLTVVHDGVRTPVLVRGVRLLDGGYLLVGQDASGIEHVRAVIARAFAVGGAVTLVFAAAAGFVFSRRILGRLAAVGRASQEIMQGDLTHRLPTRGTGDEFDQLIDGFNTLLGRIAALVESVRQVSTDIAHDLRTPLARLLQRLEDVRRGPHTEAEYLAAIDRSISDAGSILATFGALLRVAEIEASTDRGRFEELDASELVAVTAELYGPLADERAQTMTTEASPVRLRGERELLIQMLGNLLENACRHSPPHAHIRIGAAAREGQALFWVQDDGPGIPETEREKVFRRFYRLEASRTTPGSGIGLSLVAAVAARHGGRVVLSDARPGLRAEVWLPRTSQAAEERRQSVGEEREVLRS